jgi:hypothetical protein
VLSKLEIELLTHAIYKATVDQHHMYKRDWFSLLSYTMIYMIIWWAMILIIH